MFTVKSAVLEVQSVTFQLPTGFQLLQEHEEFVDPTLLLSAPEGDYTVTLSLSHSQLPSELELLDIFSEGGYMLLSPVEQITCGALSGHCAAYLSGQQGCWEVRLDLPTIPDNRYNTLVFQFYSQQYTSLITLRNDPAIDFLLSSITC
ncbi:MAG: hypothetical protein UEU47_03145 [Oscillospiraceae bacterium]|nr:hypothetical protein [Oscillospiraceae bacterium]